MSTGWEGLKPAPIEKFHGEVMEAFHAGAEHKANEKFDVHPYEENTRYVNGIEVNRLLALFKTKIKKEYGISSDAVKEEDVTNPQYWALKISAKAVTDRETHIKRHQFLHAAFDELLADYITHTGETISGTTIFELMQWSHSQTIEPAVAEGEYGANL